MVNLKSAGVSFHLGFVQEVDGVLQPGVFSFSYESK